MSQTIILKKSAVAGKVPQAADLEIGEVAINMADRILYFKDSSGEVVAVKGDAIDPLLKIDVENGDSTKQGTVSGERVWQGAAAWFGALVERAALATGNFASKALRLSTTASSSAEQVAAAKIGHDVVGTVVQGGWAAALDSEVTVHANSEIDKVYVVGSFAQVDANSEVGAILGFEFILNGVSPTASIRDVVGFYMPDLSGVPNLDRVSNFVCFASDLKGAPMRIAGPYRRVERDDFTREITPSPYGYQGTIRQWCTGRLLLVPPSVEELPGGLMIVGAIYISKRCKMTELGVVLDTGQAGNGRLAIYEQGQEGYLGRKIWQSGNISMAGSGNKTAAVDLEMASGLYLVTFNASVTVRLRTSANCMALGIFGGPNIGDASCIPYYSLGSYPNELPANLGGIAPTGYSTTTMVDFNYLVEEL